ncbi:MAG: hypothetical protein HY515_02170 [Candidatus Aenigmarchaeota archaeon]|nr:hypothetical protein [Candidatus Aenigmarchaeota archaeon]
MRFNVLILAFAVLLIVPSVAAAQDYTSPSVMRIEQNTTPSPIIFQNYSYIDRPFGDITSVVTVGSYLSGENVVHEMTVNMSNANNRYAAVGFKASYCKIGTTDCRPFVCDYYSGDIPLQPKESKQKSCVITASDCAGREIRIEYSLHGVIGTAATNTVAKCPQKFCDQITTSIKAPGISYLGDKISAEGYISEINGEGIPSPVTVSLIGYDIKTNSNDFGYWSVPLEIKKPGYYELSAVSESCGRFSKTQIQVFQPKEITKTIVVVYPKSIDVESGGNALLAIQTNSDEKIAVSISGVPEEWVEPTAFSMSRGVKFVYISPKAGGSYTINVRSGSEEKNVSLFVAAKPKGEVKRENNPAALLVLLMGALFLLGSKKARQPTGKNKEYMDSVKKEIESAARVF